MSFHVRSGSVRGFAVVALAVLGSALCLNGETVRGSHSARDLVSQKVDDGLVTSIRSESYRLPKGSVDLGPVDAGKELDLRIDLKRSPEQQQALDSLNAKTHTPGDPMYGKTLTPAEFGEAFGISSHDMTAMHEWLEKRGFEITGESTSRMTVSFHGTAVQAEEAFKTELHSYSANGREFFASTPKLMVPAALAPIVRNIAGLQSLRRDPLSSFDGPVFSHIASGTEIARDQKSVEELNPGWTMSPAGQLTREKLKLHPDTGTATTTTVTLAPASVAFAAGTAVTITTVVAWTGAGTPTGSVTVSDAESTLSATIALSSCTLGTLKYTCTYNWTDAGAGGFNATDTLTAAYATGDGNFASSSGTAGLGETYTNGTRAPKTYSITVTPNTVVQGATTAQTITSVVGGSTAGGLPAGSLEVWGPGTIGLIHEFAVISGTGASTGCSTATNTVTCTYSWNPPATLLPGSYQLAYSYSGVNKTGTTATYEAYTLAQTTSFTVTSSGTTPTTTTVSANPSHIGFDTPGTTFTTVTTWTGSGAAPTGALSLTGPTGTFGGGPIGGAQFPATGSTTSSGSGTYDFSAYTYTYSCTTSTSAKTVTCTIVDSDVNDVLPNEDASNTVTAAYSGDTVYKSSTGTTTVITDEDDTSLSISSSPASAVAGTTPTVTYTVAINDLDGGDVQPTGTLMLSGSVVTGSPVSLTVNATNCPYSGTTFSATCTITAAVPAGVTAGSYTVTASYSGDTTYAQATGTYAFNVTGATATSMTSSASPISVNGTTPNTTITSITTWTGTGATPTGTVSLTCGSGSAGTCNTLPAAVNVSSCTISTANKTITCALAYDLDGDDSAYGAYNFISTYSGDTTYKSATSTVQVTDTENIASTTTITLSPVSSYTGTAATTTATIVIKGKAGDGAASGQVIVTGTGTLGTLATITLPATTNTQCTVVTFTTTCTVSLAIPSTTAAGSYTITATFGGSAIYNSSTGTATYTVKALDTTSTAVTATPNSISSSQSTMLQATVTDVTTGSATPTGTVAFTEGATTLGTCTLASGTCSITAAGTSLTTGTITATYTPAASTQFGGSSGTTTITVSANIVFSSVSHNFGSVVAGTATTGTENYGVSVTNNGTAAFTITGVTLTGSSAYTETTNCTTIAAGKSCEIIFTFTPPSTGGYTATWSVNGAGNSYSPSNGGTLSGTGVASAGVTLSTNKHNFGSVAVGTTTAVFGAVVTNSTASNITLAVAAPTGNTADFITTLNNCGATLYAGQSCNLQYTFKPVSAAGFSEVIGVTANGGATTITANGSATTGLTLVGTGH